MADEGEAPTLFEDEPSAQPQAEEQTSPIFGETTEISLDSDDTKKDEEEVLKEEPKDEPKHEDVLTKPEEVSASSTTDDATKLEDAGEKPEISSRTKIEEKEQEVEEEEEEDTFDMNITVTNPEKVGDGMSAYVIYHVTTRTSMPTFKSAESCIRRRFSDFLGLHERLNGKYLHSGIVVPPAPEKSVVGMGKVKLGKEDTSSSDFLDKRRASLERYLNRVANHKLLRKDPDFREFLEAEELPRAKDTAALSGGGLKRFVKSVGDTVFNLTTKMPESDQWFEEKQHQIETLDQQLKKLHQSIDILVVHRKDLGVSTAVFAKSAAMISNSEEHSSLSRALSQLAEVEEKMEQIHVDQANGDYFVFAELVKEYIGLIAAIKNCFHERVKCYSSWQHAQQTLTKKREAQVKLELAGKNEKLPQAQEEVKEWEQRVEKGDEDFQKISKTIRKELGRFEANRVRDFRDAIIKYLEAMMQTQQQVIKYWEGFLPEAKAIA